MEKIPGFRMVGGASEEVKEKAKEEIEFRLTDHIASLPESGRKELERMEYPKSPGELALIAFANEETNRLRIEAGIEPYELPPENYHIVPEESYKKVTTSGSTAVCFFNKQGIAFDATELRGNPVFFGTVAFHETLHLKGHFTLEVEQDGEKTEKTPYREGVTARAAQKKGLQGEYHSHFDGLHEAIVSEQQKRSFPNMMNLPELDAERIRLYSEETNKLKEAISEKEKIPFEDIIWVGEKENEYETISYRKQREVLTYVCEEISSEFPDEYPTTDDAYREFLKAHFTGRLLPIARLVEGVFGEGSFRMLGDMKPNRESGVLTLESLRKTRLRKATQ